GGANHLAHTVAAADAKVVDSALSWLQTLQRRQMGSRQIVHVDVIADAGAVRRGVVRAEDFNRGAPAENRLKDKGNEVRFRIVIFADGPIRARTRGVEVAQGGKTPTISRRILA